MTKNVKNTSEAVRVFVNRTHLLLLLAIISMNGCGRFELADKSKEVMISKEKNEQLKATASQVKQVSGQIGHSAIWTPGPDFVSKVYQMCNWVEHARWGDCAIDLMAAAGAPADAVSFAREFERQYSNEVVIITGFENFGSADLVSVQYPFRPIFRDGSQVGTITGLVLMSHDANAPDTGDPNNIDKHDLEKWAFYQECKKKHPKLYFLHGNRKHGDWLIVEQQNDGTLQYKEEYEAIDGENHEIYALLGAAVLEWDFDASGKFLKTKFLGFFPFAK